MLRPDFITFTGADDATSILDMEALAADHAVEFAILFSRSREGDARYPTIGWMNDLHGRGLKLAAHVCGHYAHEIVQTGRSEILDRLVGYDRIQINTAAKLDLDLIAGFRSEISDRADRDIGIILQTRHSFPEDPRVQWLFDASGGRGLAPAAWPEPPMNPDVRIGYAGGIGPENVSEVVRALPDIPNAWIDMETKIRNARDEFDLALCREVCEKVAFEHEGLSR